MRRCGRFLADFFGKTCVQHISALVLTVFFAFFIMSFSDSFLFFFFIGTPFIDAYKRPKMPEDNGMILLVRLMECDWRDHFKRLEQRHCSCCSRHLWTFLTVLRPKVEAEGQDVDLQRQSFALFLIVGLCRTPILI